MRDLSRVMAESWPPETEHRFGPWLLRQAPGAGNRVTCATAEGAVTPGDLPELVARARALGQVPNVMVHGDEPELDAVLAGAGWRMGEDVIVLTAPLEAFGPPPPPVTTFAVWPPLAIQREFWMADHTGPEKQRVMDRAPARKAAILGRMDDRPAGTAFVAVAGGMACLHALTVRPEFRRRGLARHILAAAAHWARENEAAELALAVTRGNSAARALYASLGMKEVGHWHYRVT